LQWLSLPGGGGAGWGGVVSEIPGGDLLHEHRLSAGYLGYYGVELLASGGKAAVGGVVAEPGDVRDAGIEVGELERDYVAVGAVDQEPGTSLPDPMLRLVGGKRVVQAQGPANRYAAVGYIVGFAGSPLLDLVVDQQWTNPELLLVSGVSGGIAGCGIWDLPDSSEVDGVNLGLRRRVKPDGNGGCAEHA